MHKNYKIVLQESLPMVNLLILKARPCEFSLCHDWQHCFGVLGTTAFW